MRLITVVMNEPDTNTRNSETTSMLDYGFNNYSIDSILTKEEVVGKVKVDLGDKKEVEVVPISEVNVLNNKTKDKREVSYDVKLNSVKAPIKVGEKVGTLIVKESNKEIMQVDLTVKEDIKKANIFKAYIRNLEDVITGSN